MFDVGAFEIFMIVIVALVVIKPADLPAFFRTAGNFLGKIRSMGNEFRYGIQSVIDEAERQVKDPFDDERKAEGLKPDMSPEEITDHIMENRKREAAEAAERGEAIVDPLADDPKGEADLDRRD